MVALINKLDFSGNPCPFAYTFNVNSLKNADECIYFNLKQFKR